MKKLFIVLGILSSIFIFSQEEADFYEIKAITRKIQDYSATNPDSALVEIDHYLKQYKSNFAQAELYLQQASAFGFLGKRSEALNSALKARSFSFRGNNYSQRARTSGLLANRYRDILLTDKAKESLRQGLLETGKIKDSQEKYRVESILLTEYCKNLTEEKQYDSATIYYTRSLKSLSKLEPSDNVKFQIVVTHLGMGTNYLMAKKWELAEKELNKVIQLSEKGVQWERYNLSSAKLYLSVVFTYREEYQKAINILLEAENLTTPNDPKLAELYYFLAQNYLKMNDDKSYQKYNKLYLVSKSNLSEENVKAMNLTVQLLDNALQKEQKAKIFNRNIAAGIGFLAVLLLAGIILYYKRKQKKNKQLYQKAIKRLEDKITDNIRQENITIESAEQEKTFIPKNIEEELLGKLNKFEKSEKFINPKLSLSILASQLETNTSYLSYVINTYKGKHFNQYINELRIDYICNKIIHDPEFRNYKISYLAEACGFSTYASFNSAFKSVTGISPSVFLKESFS
ncbi:hypothetical protein CHRYSEOSP005_04400 [Chryseobacterium sp. Alg-005]|uniref:helix-turn-helix domain-containing protein n=1 Tax=Chryseobacterium sp. Alg-005 TaxID=3159516 RepID=UPI003555BE14